MKVYFLTGILLFYLLALEDSEAAPLKTEKEQDRLRKSIVKVGRDCKTSGFQPKDGSICLKLTVVAGVNVNFGLGYEEKDKKQNGEKGIKSVVVVVPAVVDKNEDGKQNQGQQKTLNKDRGRKQEQKQQKQDLPQKRLKDPRNT